MADAAEGRSPDLPSARPIPGQQPIPGLREYSYEETRIEQWRFQSPLLPPAVLRQYEELVPGFSQRYMDAWERQGQHRQRLESAVVATQTRTQMRGQTYALILGIAALFVAAILGVTDHEAAAIAVVGMDFVSLGGAFVYAKVKEGRELRAKAEDVPDPRPSAPPARQLPKAKPTPPRPPKKRKGRRR